MNNVNLNSEFTFKALAAFFHWGTKFLQWPHLMRRTKRCQALHINININHEIGSAVESTGRYECIKLHGKKTNEM